MRGSNGVRGQTAKVEARITGVKEASAGDSGVTKHSAKARGMRAYGATRSAFKLLLPVLMRLLPP